MSRPIRVLFLCTGNSARSQIAEALLARKGGMRFEVASAGSRPAARVNPLAVEVLRQVGIDWSGREPQGVEAVMERPWDVVITVCDRAKESCPILPGNPVTAHWGLPDPAEVEGTEDERRRAFAETLRALEHRIDALVELPPEELDRMSLEPRLRSIHMLGEPPEPRAL
jgi:arsenate reductase